MDARSIGVLKPIRDIEPGQCILFSYEERSELGMIVSFSGGDRAILHFGARTDEIETPCIYGIDRFFNDDAIHIAEARIVPTLAPEHVGFGCPSGRTVSIALFIKLDAVFLMARVGRHDFSSVNLFTGSIGRLDTTRIAYTKAWHIEVPDAQGGFEPYHEYRCEEG